MKSRLHAASFVWIRVHSWLNQRFLKKSIGGFSESVGALNHSFDARGAARPPPVPIGAAFGHINAHCPAPCGAGQAGSLSYCIVPVRLCPGGTFDNSPAFQRRERSTKRPRPEGTVEARVGTGRRFTGGSAAAPAAVGRALAPNRSASKRTQWSWNATRNCGSRGRDPQRPRRARSPIPLHRSMPGRNGAVGSGGNGPPARSRRQPAAEPNARRSFTIHYARGARGCRAGWVAEREPSGLAARGPGDDPRRLPRCWGAPPAATGDRSRSVGPTERAGGPFPPEFGCTIPAEAVRMLGDPNLEGMRFEQQCVSE